MNKLILTTALAVGGLLWAGGSAADGSAADAVQLYADAIVINKSASTSALRLTVSGPNNYSFRSATGTSKDAFGLLDMNVISDGLYKYEIRQYAYLGERTVSDPANGRDSATQKIVDSVKTSSGIFRVKNGSIVLVDKSAKEESPLSGASK